MEWNLIEKKWHEMAGRLQAVSPALQQAQNAASDNQSPNGQIGAPAKDGVSDSATSAVAPNGAEGAVAPVMA